MFVYSTRLDIKTPKKGVIPEPHGGGFAQKSLHMDFSVQSLCSLCLCGVFLLGIHQPQRTHRDCTEKRACMTFCAKPCGLSAAIFVDLVRGGGDEAVFFDDV